MTLDFDINRAFELAKKLAREAGEKALVMRSIPKMPYEIPSSDASLMEASRDIRTSGDIFAQNLILELIIKEGLNNIRVHVEDKHFTTEPMLVQFAADGPYRWVIDAIDGSANYGYGNDEIRRFNIKMCESIGRDPAKDYKPDEWGTMISLEREGTPLFGIIYLPIQKRLFSAQKGNQAFVDDKQGQRRISASHHDIFNISDIVYANSKLFGRLENASKGLTVQHHGCYAFTAMKIAEGAECIIIAEQPKIHDLIPPMCIVREAGGVVLDQHAENAISTSKYVIYGPNRDYVASFLQMFQEIFHTSSE